LNVRESGEENILLINIKGITASHILIIEKRNRALQKARNKKRQKDPVQMIVKTDALLLHPREDGAYMLLKVKKEMIVNRNALSLQPSIDGAYALFKVKEKRL